MRSFVAVGNVKRDTSRPTAQGGKRIGPMKEVGTCAIVKFAGVRWCVVCGVEGQKLLGTLSHDLAFLCGQT